MGAAASTFRRDSKLAAGCNFSFVPLVRLEFTYAMPRSSFIFTIIFIFKRKVGTSNAQQPLLQNKGEDRRDREEREDYVE